MILHLSSRVIIDIIVSTKEIIKNKIKKKSINTINTYPSSIFVSAPISICSLNIGININKLKDHTMLFIINAIIPITTPVSLLLLFIFKHYSLYYHFTKNFFADIADTTIVFPYFY